MEISDIKEGVRFVLEIPDESHIKQTVYTIKNITDSKCDVTWWGEEKRSYQLASVVNFVNSGVWLIIQEPITEQTKDQLLAQIAELQKQVEEIDKKESDKYYCIVGYKFFHESAFVRCGGEFKDKGYFLDPTSNWEIIKDSENHLVLVPTKKQ